VAISWSICQIIGLFVSGWQLYKRGLFLKPKIVKKQIQNLAKRSLGIGLDSVIYRLGANLTNIVLPLYLTSYQIGIFNGAFRPFTLLVLGNQCCIQYFSPYIASERYGTKEAMAKKLECFHKISTFFTATILILPLFFAETLCRTLFGSQLADSAQFMRMLSLGYLIYYLPPYAGALKALGFEWRVLWSSVTQVVVNLVCFFILVPLWGIKGAVVSVILAYTSYWIVGIFVYWIEGIRPVKNISNYLIFLSLTVLSGWILYRYFTQGIPGIISFLFVSSILSCLVYWNREERRMAFRYIKRPAI
jgi:O-antigen/teichoic acid export membrane protein